MLSRVTAAVSVFTVYCPGTAPCIVFAGSAGNKKKKEHADDYGSEGMPFRLIVGSCIRRECDDEKK